jgi:cytochrome c oxidase subunit II
MPVSEVMPQRSALVTMGAVVLFLPIGHRLNGVWIAGQPVRWMARQNRLRNCPGALPAGLPSKDDGEQMQDGKVRITGMMFTRLRATVIAAVMTAATGSLLWAGAAMAAQPVPWQLDMQDPVTPVAERILSFNHFLMVIITAITLFVLALLIYVMVKFNAKANPVPSHNHHNTMLEVAWTVIPVIVLVIIAIPSFKDLYYQYSFPKPDLTIKATGHQWYWSYEYPDVAGVTFDSNMLNDADREKLKAQGIDAPRLLAVDNEIVVPVNKVVHVLTTSQDVIHNWTIPAFGSKTDAVPGRVLATWFQATKPGAYYGPCSELCGANHAYMPIAVRVVSDEVYAKWLEARKAGGKDVDQKAFEVIKQAAVDETKKMSVAQTAP